MNTHAATLADALKRLGPLFRGPVLPTGGKSRPETLAALQALAARLTAHGHEVEVVETFTTVVLKADGIELSDSYPLAITHDGVKDLEAELGTLEAAIADLDATCDTIRKEQVTTGLDYLHPEMEAMTKRLHLVRQQTLAMRKRYAEVVFTLANATRI